MKRNLRDEIEQALAGGAPERMPFTYYDLLTPPGFDLAPLQARGLAICARRPVWRKTYADVEVHEQAEPDGIVDELIDLQWCGEKVFEIGLDPPRGLTEQPVGQIGHRLELVQVGEQTGQKDRPTHQDDKGDDQHQA